MIFLWTILLLITAVFSVWTWWILYSLHRRRRKQEFLETIINSMGGGSALVLPPEKAIFRGAYMGFGRQVRRGILCLSRQRLVFFRLDGTRIDLPLEGVKACSMRRFFLGRGSSRYHLIVTLQDGNEVGFYVSDPETWALAVVNHEKEAYVHDPFHPPAAPQASRKSSTASSGAPGAKWL